MNAKYEISLGMSGEGALISVGFVTGNSIRELSNNALEQAQFAKFKLNDDGTFNEGDNSDFEEMYDNYVYANDGEFTGELDDEFSFWIGRYNDYTVTIIASAPQNQLHQLNEKLTADLLSLMRLPNYKNLAITFHTINSNTIVKVNNDNDIHQIKKHLNQINNITRVSVAMDIIDFSSLKT